MNGISKTVEGRCSEMQQDVTDCQVEKLDQVKTLPNLRLNMHEIEARENSTLRAIATSVECVEGFLDWAFESAFLEFEFAYDLITVTVESSSGHFLVVSELFDKTIPDCAGAIYTRRKAEKLGGRSRKRWHAPTSDRRCPNRRRPETPRLKATGVALTEGDRRHPDRR